LTKVNRCLTEGRLALTGRLTGIEEGAECTRMAPLLSALADGEADAAALARLRPHLKTCLNCRARLREYRAAPGRVAALVPAGLMAGRPEALLGWTQQKVDALLVATHHKAAALHRGRRAQGDRPRRRATDRDHRPLTGAARGASSADHRDRPAIHRNDLAARAA